MEVTNDLSDLTEGAIKVLDLVKAMGKMWGGKAWGIWWYDKEDLNNTVFSQL